MNAATLQMTTKKQSDQPGELDATTACGWYLYGITHGEQVAELVAAVAQEQGEPLQALEQCQLAAIIKPVPLEEFSAEALRLHAEDLSWLEAMVRGHNRIIEGIHQNRPVLPARFGAVYPSREALQTALAERHDQLLALLQQLEGCDEWGVRLYADHRALQQLAIEHPSLRSLKSEVARATPGRAYLLKRKLADELVSIIEQALDDLAQASYARLKREAVAGQFNVRASVSTESGGEREVFHALLLVRRDHQATFLEKVQRLAEEHAEMHCEYSGPWPPYSFARIAGEEAP
ncbi:MAG TPA: GvpL/GvpF family gas vesicle protein [Ktedonobacterales bacterium]